jgi:very-short-patch-repair endonuclease
MGTTDRNLDAIAKPQKGLLERANVIEVGGSDHVARRRVRDRSWQRLQRGVYLTGSAPATWRQQLRAATLAAGPPAAASHRAAASVWGLDGFATAPLELTVPITCGPLPANVIVHRTRRFDPRDVTVLDGQPVTVVERTILDLCRDRSWRTVEVALESAVRHGLTTQTKMRRFLDESSRQGRKGVRKMRALLDEREGQRAAGSAAEVAFLRLVRRAGLPRPERQYRIDLGQGEVVTVDFAWPRHRFAVEVDGFGPHGSREAFYRDRARGNAIQDRGWGLRRVTPHDVRHRAEAVVAAIQREVCGVAAHDAPKLRTLRD